MLTSKRAADQLTATHAQALGPFPWAELDHFSWAL